MSPLEADIRAAVMADGPMGLDRYMGLCLFHPLHGYYATGHPIGARGDFVTAPEVSQMFGELCAVWLMSRAGTAPIHVVEMGPGRGTLALDLDRTMRGRIPFKLHLIERSSSLRETQRGRLGDDVTWHETLEDFAAAADGPVLLVANELLDALPFRQFVREADRWRERVVTLDGDRLAFALREAATDLSPAPEGTVREVSPAREALADGIASLVAERGGAALLFDYGSLAGGTGDTFQAVRDHAPCDPLDRPGTADLTSHVDFEALALTAEAHADVHLATQGEFLLRMGLLERAGRLGADADGETRTAIEAAVHRLAHPDGMGDLFKTMAIVPRGTAPPAGFEERA